MGEQKNEPIPPTMEKILDEYLAALHADEKIDNVVADRLDALLRKGKIPKFDDIDSALFPQPEGSKP